MPLDEDEILEADHQHTLAELKKARERIAQLEAELSFWTMIG